MELELTDDEAADLRQLLDESISDMSMEIAATDNAQYRTSLRDRRERLRTVRANLDGTSA